MRRLLADILETSACISLNSSLVVSIPLKPAQSKAEITFSFTDVLAKLIHCFVCYQIRHVKI